MEEGRGGPLTGSQDRRRDPRKRLLEAHRRERRQYNRRPDTEASSYSLKPHPDPGVQTTVSLDVPGHRGKRWASFSPRTGRTKGLASATGRQWIDRRPAFRVCLLTGVVRQAHSRRPVHCPVTVVLHFVAPTMPRSHRPSPQTCRREGGHTPSQRKQQGNEGRAESVCGIGVGHADPSFSLQNRTDIGGGGTVFPTGGIYCLHGPRNGSDSSFLPVSFQRTRSLSVYPPCPSRSAFCRPWSRSKRSCMCRSSRTEA